MLPLILALLSQSESAKVTIYASDPEHLWNRLYAELWVRRTKDPSLSGLDRIDPLIWSETRNLLEGPSHQRAIALVDEFLKERGERQIEDPLRRALFQRDLWALFDGAPYTDPKKPGKVELRARLGKAIGRLSLSEEEIRKLPDTYAEALGSGSFAKAYDPKEPLKPFLPPDLFEEKGPWVCLSRGDGESIAPTHRADFSGRSVFLVFLRLPGGRQATLDWLKDRPTPLPAGTLAALVRRALALNAERRLQETAITESVQIRVFREEARTYERDGRSISTMQDTFEFLLSRELLLARKSGGFRALEWEERDFPTPFRVHMEDPIETGHEERPTARPRVRQACMGCHLEELSRDNRITLQSFRFGRGDPPAPSTLVLQAGSTSEEGKRARAWKEGQPAWTLLAGIVEADAPRK